MRNEADSPISSTVRKKHNDTECYASVDTRVLKVDRFKNVFFCWFVSSTHLSAMALRFHGGLMFWQGMRLSLMSERAGGRGVDAIFPSERQLLFYTFRRTTMFQPSLQKRCFVKEQMLGFHVKSTWQRRYPHRLVPHDHCRTSMLMLSGTTRNVRNASTAVSKSPKTRSRSLETCLR